MLNLYVSTLTAVFGLVYIIYPIYQGCNNVIDGKKVAELLHIYKRVYTHIDLTMTG